MADSDLDVPKETSADHAYNATKGVFASVPIVGGAAAEILALVLQPPLERRKSEWMENVATALRDLQSRGLDLNALRDNDEFISVVLEATQIALRTHQEAKRQALRNVVLNTGLGTESDDALHHLYLNLVDQLSVMQLTMLNLFRTPPDIGSMSMGALSSILERSIPSLRGRRGLYDQLWRDLHQRGLVNTENLHVTMSSGGLASRRTTSLGDGFLAFISEPR